MGRGRYLWVMVFPNEAWEGSTMEPKEGEELLLFRRDTVNKLQKLGECQRAGSCGGRARLGQG